MKEIALHILDIVQNSITAQASVVWLEVTVDTQADRLTVLIHDNGCGMDAEMLRRVTDPFITSRTTRRVGLGLPLFKANAEQAGGKLEINSHPGEGTVVIAEFGLGHIDRPPMGDLVGTMMTLISGAPKVAFYLALACDERTYLFSTAKVCAVLGDVPILMPEVVQWMKENIADGINTTFGGINV